MKRTNVHLTEQQIERLSQLSKSTGLSVAELIRRAIDYYLDEVSWPRPSEEDYHGPSFDEALDLLESSLEKEKGGK